MRSLNLDQFCINRDNPNSYTLLMLDCSFYKPTSSKWDQIEDLKDIGPKYLRPNIVTNDEISFAKTIEETKSKKQWIRSSKKKFVNNEGHEVHYYVVESFVKSRVPKSSKLLSSLSGYDIYEDSKFNYNGGVIIFPYTEQYSMAYGFGKWNRILDPVCVVPLWGLRTLSSNLVCNPDNIKELNANYYRKSNPISRKEKSCSLQHIEEFGLELGSEELHFISLMPNSESISTIHLISGSNFIKFTIPYCNPEEEECDVIESLNIIARHFFEISTSPSFHIHPRLNPYIDTEIKNRELIDKLFKYLEEKLRNGVGNKILFLNTILWREMNAKKLLFGNGEESVFEVFKNLNPNECFPKKIKVRKLNEVSFEEFDVWRIFLSIPIEFEGEFYRMNSGRWYKVDSSRFENIRRILNDLELSSKSLHLPSYTVEDSCDQSDYKEAVYNKKAFKEISKIDGWQAIHLDRISIQIGDSKDIFELADLLVINGKKIYFLHIKRAKSKQLSHLIEQVNRTVEFLTKELKKENAVEVLMKGFFNSFNMKNGISIKKKEDGDNNNGQSIFKTLYEKSLKEGEDFSFFKLQERNRNKELASFVGTIKKIIKNKGYYTQFKKHQKDVSAAMDCLWNCIHKNKSYQTFPIEDFLRDLEQVLKVKEWLLPNGLLKKSNLKKITIVLTIIDDRKIGNESRNYKNLPLFKNQVLWSLDRTRNFIQKSGLGFKIAIVNKDEQDASNVLSDYKKTSISNKENVINYSNIDPIQGFKKNSTKKRLSNRDECVLSPKQLKLID